MTTLSTAVIPLLENHLRKVRVLHEQDLERGHGEVYLPHALERKYPSAAKKWGWQYVFPARDVCKDPLSGVVRRHHVDPAVVTRRCVHNDDLHARATARWPRCPQPIGRSESRRRFLRLRTRFPRAVERSVFGDSNVSQTGNQKFSSALARVGQLFTAAI